MKRLDIEKEARKIQVELWLNSKVRYPLGVPPMHAVIDPIAVAEFLGLQYEFRDAISAKDGHRDSAAAGMINIEHGIISISTQFKSNVQRFTGAHEIGHWVLHSHLIRTSIHRDLPINASGDKNYHRSPIEKEADYFAACLLAPKKLVITEFRNRFGNEPLVLTENTAFHLKGQQSHELFINPHNRSLNFSLAVASAQKFSGYPFKSLHEQFGMSVSSMAIRLKELELIIE